MNERVKDELCHKWSDIKKAAYNREYYQRHKDWWKTRYDHEPNEGETMAYRYHDASIAFNDARRLRSREYTKSANNKRLANAAERAGIPGAAKELRDISNHQVNKAAEYANQMDFLWSRKLKPMQGDYERYMAETRLHNSGKANARSDARINKAGTKADELRRKLEWKTAPSKNKAKRKAKEFVSNWKSGAQGIKSAAKSASSKVGKKFLDTKIPGVERVTTIGWDHPTTTRRPVTVRDAINGMKRK